MSRGQESQAFNTASGQNSGYYNNAQTSYGDAQADIGQYESELGKLAAKNPYVSGGEFAKAQTQILSNTSDAGAASMKQALQDQARRTGQNMAGANATAESIAEANERALSGQEAEADKERTASEATYNRDVLNATAKPAELESGLYGQSIAGANGALGVEAKAGEQPSFWESLMQSGMDVSKSAAGAGAFN